MRRKHRRDSVIPKRGMPLKPRTLSMFRREVVVLLMVGHRFTADRAIRAVKRWDRYVRARWNEGKPPCAVSDHLSKWEKEKAICPCTGDSHDPSCPRHGRRSRSRRSSGSRRARDADDPKDGETYESKSGKRWVVRSSSNNRVQVDLAGVRQTGTLTWDKKSLKGMKQVGDPVSRRRRRRATRSGKRRRRGRR